MVRTVCNLCLMSSQIHQLCHNYCTLRYRKKLEPITSPLVSCSSMMQLAAENIQALTMESQGSTGKTILRILQEWLEGRGQEPVTWQILIKTLKDSDLSVVADEIQQKLFLNRPQFYQSHPPLPASSFQPSGKLAIQTQQSPSI